MDELRKAYESLDMAEYIEMLRDQGDILLPDYHLPYEKGE